MSYFDGIKKYYPKFRLPSGVVDADCREFARVFDEPVGSNVLEIGCSEEPLSYALAMLGFNVVGVDTRYGYLPKDSKLNYTFIKGDFFKTNLSRIKFKAVLLVSTLEHVGLGIYDDEPTEDGDIKMVDILYNMLDYGSHVYVTVPVGVSGCNGHWRVYSAKALEDRIVRQFKVKSKIFFASDNYDKYKIGDYVKEKHAFNSTGPEISALLVLEK